MNGRSTNRWRAITGITMAGALLILGGCSAARPQRATVEPTWSYVRAQPDADHDTLWPVSAEYPTGLAHRHDPAQPAPLER